MAPLAWVAVATALFLTLYENIRSVLAPNMKHWESHALTIVLVTTISTIAAYVVLRYRARAEERYALEQQKRGAAETEASARRELARVIIDNAGAVVVTLSPDRRIIEFNPEAEHVYGRTRAEVVGQDYMDLFVPEAARAAVVADMQKVMDGQPTRGFENEIVIPSGQARVFSWSVNRYLDNRRKPAGVVAIGLDITDRRQNEMELAKSHARNAALLATLPDMVFILDADGAYVDVELTTEFKPYVDPKDFLGRNLNDVLPPDVAAESHRYLKRALTTREQQHFEYRLPIDGELHDYEARLSVLGQDQVMVVVSDITERKRVEIKLDLSYRTQRALNALLKLSLAEMELGEQLHQALDIILEAPFMQLTAKGGIFLAVADKPELELRATRNLPETLTTMCGKVPFGECLCGRAAAEGRMLFSGPGDARHEHHYEGMVPHGHYVVPIKSAAEKGRTLGVIILYIDPEHPRKEEEERFLRAAANVLAGLIEKSEARQRLADSERQYRTLAEAAPDIVVIIDRDRRLEYINSIGAKRLGGAPVEMVGQSVGELLEPQTAQTLFNQVDRVLGGGEAALFEQVVETSAGPTWLEVQMVPLTANGEVYSVMGIGRDITERKESEQSSRSLNNINLAINSTLDIDRIMEVVVEEASKAVGAESGVVAERSGDFWEIKYVAGSLPKNLMGRKVPLAEAADFNLVSASDKPTILERTEAETAAGENGWTGPLATRTFLGAPLTVKNRQVGVLAFLNHGTRRSFTPQSTDFVAKLAVSVSLALENARLFAREHGIAKRLQSALLTIHSELDGIKVGHLYRSATREAALVGGDFYDLFDLGPGRIGLIIGDVSGKGLEAATITSLVKNTIQAFAHYHESPAVVVERANAVVAKSVPGDAFVTAFYATLETSSGKLTYTCAGHPPPLLQRETGQIDTLEPSGPVLGAFDHAGYRESLARLNPGDTLLCYTDGLTEARRGANFFGEDRVMKMMGRTGPCEPSTCVAEAFETVMRFTGGNLSDDLALLAISLDISEHHTRSRAA